MANADLRHSACRGSKALHGAPPGMEVAPEQSPAGLAAAHPPYRITSTSPCSQRSSHRGPHQRSLGPCRRWPGAQSAPACCARRAIRFSCRSSSARRARDAPSFPDRRRPRGAGDRRWFREPIAINRPAPLSFFGALAESRAQRSPKKDAAADLLSTHRAARIGPARRSALVSTVRMCRSCVTPFGAPVAPDLHMTVACSSVSCGGLSASGGLQHFVPRRPIVLRRERRPDAGPSAGMPGLMASEPSSSGADRQALGTARESLASPARGARLRPRSAAAPDASRAD